VVRRERLRQESRRTGRQLGYVALAADIYGEGFVTDDPKVAGPKSAEAKQAGLPRRRGLLALDALKKHAKVDPAKTAAIGYCFGGHAVLEMARGGGDLAGVVSFHGALKTEQPAQAGQVKPRVLVLHGDADPFVPPAEVEAFEKEMTDAKVNYQVIKYPGAVHSFTNPNASKPGLPPDAVAYDKTADVNSWAAMKDFFTAIFNTKP
jgi:dienelactone hydrolase